MFRKSFTVSFLLLNSFSTFAGDLMDSAADLDKSSSKVVRLSERVELGNARNAVKKKLKQELTQIIQLAKQMRSSIQVGGDLPSPNPGGGGGWSRNPIYTGKCHIDDDSDLSLNQNVVDIQGATIPLLIEDCKAMAQAMYSRQSHSSAVMDIKIQGSVPAGMQTGSCHVDDDPDMSFEQFVVGTIYGESIQDIISDCAAIAKLAYKSQASSGLKTINDGINVPANMVSGICHIDDDPDMSFDQFVPGVVFGHSIQAISNDCRALAESTFGHNSASGLKDIQR